MAHLLVVRGVLHPKDTAHHPDDQHPVDQLQGNVINNLYVNKVNPAQKPCFGNTLL